MVASWSICKFKIWQCGILLLLFFILLQNFHHVGFDNHKRIWSLTEVPKLIDFLSFIQDMELRKLAEDVINTFTNKVVKNYHMFQKGKLHNKVCVTVHFQG
jgi:hypothetical protein